MKKVLVSLLAAASALVAFSGCAKENVVKMGTNAAFVPFEYLEGQEIVGFDATMGELIAKDYGKELKIVDMEFDSLIAALQSGSIDFIAAGMTATEERRQNVDFSEPYYSSKQVIIVKADDDSVSSVEVLNDSGKSVGCQAGTTGELYIEENLPQAKCESFKTAIDASLALKNGSISAIIIDELPAKSIVKNTPELKIVDDDFATEEYAIAVKKGNTELLDSINKTIAKMKENGNYEKLLEAFMPADGNIKVLRAKDLM